MMNNLLQSRKFLTGVVGTSATVIVFVFTLVVDLSPDEVAEASVLMERIMAGTMILILTHFGMDASSLLKGNQAINGEAIEKEEV